jgi:hypothetical protein
MKGMNKILSINILALLLCYSTQLFAQKDRKVTFIGGARSVMTNNRIAVTDTLLADTTTAKRNTGGYALIDLGVNIKPNKNTEIMGMFRIRNGFGGFWGSAVTFDVRQLYMKGIVANTLRYQLGDLNLKQSPFTLYNHHADAIDSLPAIFNLQRNIVNYEKFYMNNTWRMQGANVDFGLTFKDFIKEMNFTGFLTRVNATNFSNIPERLMAGGSIDVVQSKKFRIGYNVNSVFDVLGTVKDSNVFRNNVQSIDAKLTTPIGSQFLTVAAEVGNSNYRYTIDTLAPELKDYFAHAHATIRLPKYNVSATVGYLNVGPEYRSIGAQSKDVNYNALPAYYDRYTNAQNVRPLGLMDVVTNENVYNRTISSRLMSANNLFNNAMPYGIATFNRTGLYGQVHYKKDIDATVSYYNLSEIKGQGTLALRNFSIGKLNVMAPLHTYLNMKNKLELQVGYMFQNTNRNSDVALENVNFKNTQATIGIRYELFKDFDLLGGFVLQNTVGDDFIADRNSYTEVTYFTQQKYDIRQQLSGLGFRYNFTPKIYLSAIFQQGVFVDDTKSTANYNINQFGIIYNMLF